MKPSHRAWFEEHASPEALLERLGRLRHKRAAIQGEMAWLEKLLIRRSREVAAGTWPPKPEEPA